MISLTNFSLKHLFLPNMKKIIIRIIFLSLVMFCCASLYSQNWQHISEGLEYGAFPLEKTSKYGNSTVNIIRINPAFYDFELLLASEQGGKNRNIKDWVNEFNLIGGTNAGMFQTDYSTGCGYLVNYEHKNNPSRHTTYNMYFVCNPKSDSLPEAQMVDWEEPGVKNLIAQYNSALQCIRMIAAGGENVWSKQTDLWSEAALGQDIDGNILFIFCRSPYAMHDLIDQLLLLPINLDKMMHLEGGPEASLYIDNNDFHLECMGSYETNFVENDNQAAFWQIPNVIGIKKR